MDIEKQRTTETERRNRETHKLNKSCFLAPLKKLCTFDIN